jgi:hypothetical protein
LTAKIVIDHVVLCTCFYITSLTTTRQFLSSLYLEEKVEALRGEKQNYPKEISAMM